MLKMSLSALEAIMTEFFSPLTSNARKREIEEMLSAFSHQSDAWRQSLDFMAKTGNHHVCMFALNVIEVKNIYVCLQRVQDTTDTTSATIGLVQA